MAQTFKKKTATQPASEYFEYLLGSELLNNADKSIVPTSTALPLDGDECIIMLYFGAQWCKPCKKFTPQLSAVYGKLKEKGTVFELVYVSSDNDEEEFAEKIPTLPGFSVPYSETKRCKNLTTEFAKRGLPDLVLISAKTGLVVTYEGRTAVTNDPEGNDFPWRKFATPERLAMSNEVMIAIAILVIALILIPLIGMMLSR